jgi:hypothetical protein
VTNSILRPKLIKILKTINFMEMLSISTKTIPLLVELFFSLDYAKFILESYDIVCIISIPLCIYIGSFGNAPTQGPYLVLKLFAIN